MDMISVRRFEPLVKIYDFDLKYENHEYKSLINPYGISYIASCAGAMMINEDIAFGFGVSEILEKKMREDEKTVQEIFAEKKYIPGAVFMKVDGTLFWVSVVDQQYLEVVS